MSGRLFLDVREKRSLAYNTRSSVGELARGPVPITAYAGTQTAKTGLAVQALLDNLKRISRACFERGARHRASLSGRHVRGPHGDGRRRSRHGGVAARARTARRLLRRVSERDPRRLRRQRAEKAIGEHVREGHAVISVAGDAEKIAPVLSHFGDVIVFNPEKEFERVRTIPANPQAPIELDREAGQ